MVDMESRHLEDHCNWMLHPQFFKQINKVMDPLEEDLRICIQANPSVTKVFQLEARSDNRSHRCDDTELESVFRLCKSSLVSNTENLVEDSSGESKGGSGGPSVEDPAMVSITTGSVVQCSSPATTEGGLSDFPIGERVHYAIGCPTTSRMAIVREQCRSGGLSSAASQLVSASWHSKTTSSYESLFRKWNSWCLEWDRDPTKGPIVDVVNFLAELFQQGYQYRSLNAYRSAISSVH